MKKMARVWSDGGIDVLEWEHTLGSKTGWPAELKCVLEGVGQDVLTSDANKIIDQSTANPVCSYTYTYILESQTFLAAEELAMGTPHKAQEIL